MASDYSPVFQEEKRNLSFYFFFLFSEWPCRWSIDDGLLHREFHIINSVGPCIPLGPLFPFPLSSSSFLFFFPSPFRMAALALKRRTPSLGTLPTVPNISVIDTPLPSSSITNKPAGQGASLYHTCRSVLDKLSAVEGMAEYLEADPGEVPPVSSISTSSPSSEPSTPNSSSDPLSKLWCICRRGAPLCTLFNALNTEKPLKVDRNPSLTQTNACKASVYHFIVACRDQLKFSEEELFTITDLYQDDTNGFVKVRKAFIVLLERFLCVCVERECV